MQERYKDLDEVTPREGICVAIREPFHLRRIEESVIKRLKRGMGYIDSNY